MHPVSAVITALLSLAPALATATDNTPSNADCQAFFTRGDPALFEFVETRQQVDFHQYEGLDIASIEYVTLPVFNENDPEEDFWLFQVANKLHIDTQSDTVERQLVFRTGEKLQPKKIAETERLLRENNYLIDAMILPRQVCKDAVHLLVVVRDVWTLSPSASASRSGGESSSDIGITESNLLGSGQTLSLGYYDEEERSGYTFYYEHPDIIGDHTRMSLGLEDNSDGDSTSFELIRPFYELDSNWSSGLMFIDTNQIEEIEREDVTLNEYRYKNKFQQVYFGWSAGLRNRVVQRWKVGVASDEDIYERVEEPVSEPPQDRRLSYPWVEWSSMEDNYVTLSNIVHSHRNEDILVGFFHRVKLGHASESWDSSQDAWVFSAASSYTASFGKHHLLRLNASANGHYNIDTENPESTFYSGSAEYYHFPDHKDRWYARLQYTAGRNLNDNEELTSGGSNTLRGYPDDIQRGNRQWLFTLERRYFTDYHLLNLAYLGAAAYIDAGRTWDTNRSAANNDTLSNIGLGLRASPSKFNVNRVLHIDVAWPLVNRDEVDSYQVIVTGKVDF